MAIQHIHTYLVKPRKRTQENQEISGTPVPLKGALFKLLCDIYNRSEAECNIEITFSPTAEGIKQNECRDLILQYVDEPTKENGHKIAERLEQNTDKRSGLGLLFLMFGRENQNYKIVLSRFPTDFAIYVEEDPANFTVEFLERVFLKKKTSYKAVLFQHKSLKAGFWNGKATDRQLNSPIGEFSNYWIVDFLNSEITLTPAAGTLRLLEAMKAATEKTNDSGVKQEINAAVVLSNGLDRELISINEFTNRYALSDQAKHAISSELKSESQSDEKFQFDTTQLKRVAFRSVELSNGAKLTALSSEFDSVFEKSSVGNDEGDVRFVTKGKIVNDKLQPKA